MKKVEYVANDRERLDGADTPGSEHGIGEADEVRNFSVGADAPEGSDGIGDDDVSGDNAEPEIDGEPDNTDDDGDAAAGRRRRKQKPGRREKKKRDGSKKHVPEGGGGEGPEKKASLAEYVRCIVAELRRTTWPSKADVLKWSLVVTAVIALFALIIFAIDNFIATPLMYLVSGFYMETTFGAGQVALAVMFFASGLGSMFGVMLHAGGESNGLSDSLSSQLTGGSAVAEKNLDRLTIAMALLFVATIVLMMVFFPQGSISL